MFTTKEVSIMCSILIFMLFVFFVLFINYKNNVNQDLIDHKIIMHDPITGKLLYTSDKSPFNH